MQRQRPALILLLLLIVSMARAQFNGLEVPNIEYNPLLLINASVQKELHLTPEKASKVQSAFFDEAMKLMPIISGSAQNAKPMTQQQKGKAILAGVEKMQNRLAAMLTSPQRVRLHELTLQSIGPSAVLQPKVADQLGLTSAQRSSLTRSLAAANQKIANGGMTARSKEGWQANLNDMSKVQAQSKVEGNKALMKTLTSAQKAKWKKMQGKPFALEGFLGVGSKVAPGH